MEKISDHVSTFLITLQESDKAQFDVRIQKIISGFSELDVTKHVHIMKHFFRNRLYKIVGQNILKYDSNEMTSVFLFVNEHPFVRITNMVAIGTSKIIRIKL